MTLGAFATAAVYSDVLLDTIALVWSRKGMIRRMHTWTVCMLTWAWPWTGHNFKGVTQNFHDELLLRSREEKIKSGMIEYAWRGVEAFEEAYGPATRVKLVRGRTE